MQVFAGHRQLAPCHGFPALVRRLAIHERLGPVIGEIPARRRHAGDGRRRLRRQLAQAALHVVKEPHQLLRPAQQCGRGRALWEIHAVGHQTGRRFGNGSTLNELAQHPVMVQLGVVQVEVASVAQQGGLAVQVDARIAQLTCYRPSPRLCSSSVAASNSSVKGRSAPTASTAAPVALRLVARRQRSAATACGQNQSPRFAQWAWDCRPWQAGPVGVPAASPFPPGWGRRSTVRFRSDRCQPAASTAGRYSAGT